MQSEYIYAGGCRCWGKRPNKYLQVFVCVCVYEAEIIIEVEVVFSSEWIFENRPTHME